MSGENWLLVFGVLLIGAAAMFFLPQDVPIPVPPQVEAGPDANVQELCELRLEGRASDPNGGPASVLWTAQDDRGWFNDLTDPATIYTAPSLCGGPEIVELTLTATSETGLSAADSLLVHVCEELGPAPECNAVSAFDGVSVVGYEATRVCQPVQTTPNCAPYADAGSDITVQEGASVGLTCDGSDPDGDPVSYHWTATGGHFDDPCLLHPVYTAPLLDCEASRNVTLTLTVTDAHGASTSDSVIACVTNLNHAPYADAGSDITVQEGASVGLTCDGSDPDGDPVSYHWTATGGHFDDPCLLHPVYTAPLLDCEASRNVTLTLTVTDAHGASTSDSVIACVTNLNHAPYADAGSDITVQEGASVGLTCDGSDPDGDPVSYCWTASSGHFDDPTLLHPQFTAPMLDCEAARSVTLTLTVIDAHGASTSDSVIACVTNLNHAPYADAGSDITVQEGASVGLTCDGSDPDGDPVSYCWTASSGHFDDPTLLHPQFTAPMLDCEAARSVTLTLTVIDAHGASTSDSVIASITNVNHPPYADAGESFTMPESSIVQLTCKGSDPDGDPVSYHWTATSGHFDNPCALHPFYTSPLLECESSRDVVVTLTVTDRHGASASSSAVITVQDRPEPECVPYYKLIVTEGERVRLSGRVSDPDSNLRRHLWQSSAGQFDDSRSLCTVFTAPLLEPGESLREIEVALVAEDTCGLTSRDTRIILVVAAKHPPRVDAGPTCLLTDVRSVRLEGDVYDEDGRIANISWRITQGCATLSDSSVRNPMLLFCPDAAPGSEAVVVLTAADEEGNTSTDTIRVRFSPQTPEPCLGEG